MGFSEYSSSQQEMPPFPQRKSVEESLAIINQILQVDTAVITSETDLRKLANFTEAATVIAADILKGSEGRNWSNQYYYMRREDDDEFYGEDTKITSNLSLKFPKRYVDMQLIKHHGKTTLDVLPPSELSMSLTLSNLHHADFEGRRSTSWSWNGDGTQLFDHQLFWLHYRIQGDPDLNVAWSPSEYLLERINGTLGTGRDQRDIRFVSGDPIYQPSEEEYGYTWQDLGLLIQEGARLLLHWHEDRPGYNVSEQKVQ